MTTNIQTLPIERLHIDGGTQARVSITEAVVADYAETLTEGGHLPAVEAVFDGTAYYLTDGFHRLLANVRIGAKTIEADVTAGTLTDAKLAAYGANKGHGLQRTNADKRQAVAGMLALKPDWSDRAIARHVGVGNNMVSELRNPAVGEARKAVKAGAESPALLSDNTPGVVKDSTPAPPPAAAERTASDYEASAPTAPAPSPAAAPPAEPELEGPSDAELVEAVAEHNDKLAALEAILDADDKLAAAVAENVKLREQNRILTARVLGLTNEAAQAIRLAKSWRRKCERAGLT